MLSSSEIRRQFIDYFVQRHHHHFVPSTSVVPHDDPTLLFTNAGMNQFKDVFLNTGKRDYRRAVNTQKCIRAGGKHNDLEDVGKDTYHHTFFEMLGNWSFGDYFKEEAIVWAWDLLVNQWGLDKSRLHATVFGGDAAEGLQPDQEAADLWAKVTDIDPSHIHRCSKKDNFWEMGDTGPCGPCSEIHIDLTSDKSGGGLVNRDDARVIEIWNLVFIQFNRDSQGTLTPLPAKHVDTGMGFERICAVLQGKTSNYDTDVFEPIFTEIRDVTGAPPYGSQVDDKVAMAYRVIADHIRCLTFALTDGAVPSNEGRGYVLRRILRRAVRHGYQTLSVKEPFLYRLVPAVVDAMGETFPELKRNPQQVVDVIKEEEEGFGRTLDRGMALFETAVKQANPSGGSDVLKTGSIISAQDAFKLHDTYGFPLDLTQVMAQERSMTVDVEGFGRLMDSARQQARARASGDVDVKSGLIDCLQKESPPFDPTCFVGYSQTCVDPQPVVGTYRWDRDHYESVEQLSQGERGAIVVGRTPFYAEAGGQVGDVGFISQSTTGRFKVDHTVRIGGVYFHLGTVEEGEIHGPQHGLQPVELKIDSTVRDQTMANHTSTHLMNRALRDVLGDHVQQKGSLVDDQKLRFDFSHNAPVEADQIDRIEQTVNTDIASDLPVYTEEAHQDEAIKINSLRAVFGEKYPPKVRVVSIGVPVGDLLADPDNEKWRGCSVEFCGGTHLGKTGDAEGFVILNEEAVAKGVRRITAATGPLAHRASVEGDMLLARLETLRGSKEDRLALLLADLASAVESKLLPALARVKLRDGITQLQKKVKDHSKQQSKQAVGAVIEAANRIAQTSQGDLIVTSLDGADANALRVAMDVIRKKNPNTALLIGGVCGDKVAFLAAVPKTLIEKGLKAGDWVREVAKAAGGGGGGRLGFAQAGGKDAAKLDEKHQIGRRFAASIIQGD